MALSPRTVCMLIPSYTPLVGGSEVQLSGLLKRLDRSRVRPFVLTRRIAGTRPVERLDGAEVRRLPAPWRAGVFFFSSLAWLWRRRGDYDVLHVHSLDSPALAGAIIKALLPDKRLVQLVPRFGGGSSFDRLTRTAAGRARLRFILRRVDALIPLCPDAHGALERYGLPAGRLAPVPNGVDTARFAPAAPEEKHALRTSLGLPPRAFVGVVVARLIPRKNVAGALAAWERFAETHRDSVLYVCGEGPEMSRLSTYARAHLSGRCVLAGNVGREQLRAVLRAADVYLSFSESEGMSNAMLEAMACGLPVIASRGPGIDQLVEHEQTGFLFDPRCAEDAPAILGALADDRTRLEKMSQRVRARTAERFGFGRVAREIERLYGVRDYW